MTKLAVGPGRQVSAVNSKKPESTERGSPAGAGELLGHAGGAYP